MSIVATFTVPADSFALGLALAAVPEMRVDIERLATHSSEWVMPFLWAEGGDFEAFETAMRTDPTVDDVEPVDDLDGTRLYIVHWTADVVDVIDAIVDRHGIILEATGGNSTWSLRVRFLGRSQLSAFRDHFEADRRNFALHKLLEPDEPRHLGYGLTAEQREALVAALETGYFEIPRRTSLAELSAHLDISSNATSQRLRRGYAALVENTLTIDGGD